MKKKITTRSRTTKVTVPPRAVSKKTRELVHSAAERVKGIKEKARALAGRAREQWEESEPLRQKAKDKVVGAAHNVVAFQKDVRAGLREGVQDLKRDNARNEATDV